MQRRRNQLQPHIPVERVRSRLAKRLSKSTNVYSGPELMLSGFKNPDLISDDYNNDNNSDQPAFTFSGPITITEVNPAPPVHSASSAAVVVTATITVTSTSSISTSSIPPSSISASVPLSTSVSSTYITSQSLNIPVASAISSPSTSSTLSLAPSSESGIANFENGVQHRSNSVSGGAIAGIVITIFMFIGAVLLFLLRRHLVKKRKAAWESSIRGRILGGMEAGGGYTGGYIPATTSSFGGGPHSEGAIGHVPEMRGIPRSISPGQEFARAQSEALNVKRVPVPPLEIAPPVMSYNNPPPTGAFNIPSVLTPGGRSYASTPTVAVSSDPAAVVQYTFVPTLPDELSISAGERVRVLAEYDDGWAFCANARGEQGMVPLECLNQMGNGGRIDSRRVSSLAAARP